MTPITPRPSSEGTRPRSAATDIHSCGYFCDRPECIKAQRDELRERVAELERDAGRYRWLRRSHGSYGRRHGIVVSNYNGVMGEYKEISDIDAAIDSAMKE